MDIVLKIEGMSCSGCAASVEKALRATAGANDVRVDLAAGKAFVAAAGGADPSSFRSAVEEAGYDATVEAGAAA